MADHYFGINRGNDGLIQVQIVRGSSTGSTDMELRVGNAIGWTRADVARNLRALALEFEMAGSASDETNFPPL